MNTTLNNCIKITLISLLIFLSPVAFAITQKGIYINSSTANNTGYLKRLIQQSKEVGINTFVVDLTHAGPKYRKNIELIKKNGIRYVARIVVFPKGASKSQMHSESYWNKKYRLVQQAINLGASEIQLDYIRYSSKNRASNTNVQDVHKVIKWFKNKVSKNNVKLQIDIFGEAAYKHSKHIGQDVTTFANSVDAVCPMLYPSHFEPYQLHAKIPYKTVHNSLQAMKKRFKNQQMPFKVYTWIELSNYRYKMNNSKKLEYIMAQIKATKDAKADGWYAWSPNNQYENLFRALKSS